MAIRSLYALSTREWSGMEKDQLKVRVLETGVMEADMTWLLLKPGRIIADRNNKERQRE